MDYSTHVLCNLVTNINIAKSLRTILLLKIIYNTMLFRYKYFCKQTSV